MDSTVDGFRLKTLLGYKNSETRLKNINKPCLLHKVHFFFHYYSAVPYKR